MRAQSSLWHRSMAMGLLLLVHGCGELPQEPSNGDTTEQTDIFIALTRDFRGFNAWPSANLQPGTHASDDITGSKTMYVNATLFNASEGFPIGSIIVKTTDIGSTGVQVIHAMVKRGGDFNDGGAKNWEWFELQVRDDQEVIMWRGAEPPAGTAYGIDNPTEEQSCNDCHHGSSDADIVKSMAQIPRQSGD